MKISNGNSTDFETLSSHEISRLDSMIRGVGKGRGSTAGANPPPQIKNKLKLCSPEIMGISFRISFISLIQIMIDQKITVVLTAFYSTNLTLFLQGGAIWPPCQFLYCARQTKNSRAVLLLDIKGLAVMNILSRFRDL